MPIAPRCHAVACLLACAVALPVSTGTARAHASADSTTQPDWVRRLSISGAVLADGRWLRHSEAPLSTARSATDLYVRLMEVGLETEFVDFVSGTVVLNSEYLGDAIAPGDGRAAVDEVHIDLHPASLPFSFTLGQRTQPFGVFENPLVSEPMAQDGYETKVVGASMGAAGPRGLDISLTVYKGDTQLQHLLASGLADPSMMARPSVDAAQVDSWIAGGGATPWKDVFEVFASCLSEPGSSRRNVTLDAGFGLTIPPLGNARLDVEVIRALRRDTLAGIKFREGVTAVTLSHPIVFRSARLRNRGLYRARRAFTQSHPFNVALRWEGFEDDGLGRALAVWTVRDRFAVGGKYTMFEDSPEAVYLAAEFRNTRYRRTATSTSVAGGGEVRVRLGVEF